MRTPESARRKVGYWIVTILAFYIVVSMTVYRFRHPEMTETQLVVNSGNALLWRD